MNKFEINEVLDRLGEEIVTDMRKQVPSDLGDLERSIQYSIDKDNLVIHMNEYGIYVNDGTKPHMPPISAIEGWARRKGINPWAVAYSIKTYGTEAQPFMDDFLDFDNKYYKILVDGTVKELEAYVLDKLEELTIKNN